MSGLRAFHGDPAVKEKYLSRVIAHITADELIRGAGWDGHRGCAIGCTLNAYDHSRYPVGLGLPIWLAYLEDYIFEGLPQERAMQWPRRFLEAIPVGADVEPVQYRIAVRRMDRLLIIQRSLTEKRYGYGMDEVIRKTIAALEQVRCCHEAMADGNVCDFDAAAEAAQSAEWEADSAEWEARSARSAHSAAQSAHAAAHSAARSVHYSVHSAAQSAEWVVWSLAQSAESEAPSVAQSAMRSAAERAAWEDEADALLEELRNLCTPQRRFL